ncbi:MAG: butyrate kinase [Firmicutes bacterium]|jgi:butyrate kinase|nr:butyrate kinase [Bacillota bacterium]
MSVLEWAYTVLVINPGSTSTKIAWYVRETPTYSENIPHSSQDLSKFTTIADQYEFRKDAILQELSRAGLNLEDLDACVGRGGALKPLVGGVYAVNDRMAHDLVHAVRAQHASNLGGLIARAIADPLGIPSFIVDPVSVDEFEPLARLSGLPELPRQSLLHALSIRSTARKVARALGRDLCSVNVIVAHMGGGISISPVKHGKMVDVNGANDEGPFSAERTGSLPSGDVVRMCYSGLYTERDMLDKITRKGGLVAYLGTNDAREVEAMISRGDSRALAVAEAMGYQVAREIGAAATVLAGEVDAVALTGGLAHWDRLVSDIRRRCVFIAPIYTYPGENEMEALAEGAMRALAGLETIRVYE